MRVVLVFACEVVQINLLGFRIVHYHVVEFAVFAGAGFYDVVMYDSKAQKIYLDHLASEN